MLDKIDRYFQTLRHLRPVQVYGRLWFRAARPRPDPAPPPALRAPSDRWRPPAARAASVTGPGAFSFLNEAGDLAADGWDNPARSKLWRYNQHYFDDLNALAAPDRAALHGDLIADWIARNPPGQGTGWEPYPTSLRIVNWVKFALGGGALSPEAHHSLAVQARWLTRRLEWHLLGNHLFANAKALLFAGCYFDGAEPARWRDIALRILMREFPEQILPDGGQFELTPMYHALAFEDVLDIVNLLRTHTADLDGPARALEDIGTGRLPEMRRWLRLMTHPDGGPAFFNDTAFGIAPDTARLDAYADRLDVAATGPTEGATLLPDSGYARLETGPAVLIADMAAIGPDYLPGHAHADTLSFEASLDGQRVIVNSGISEYGTGPERLRQRGTAAHSTVIVDGRDSSEVWSGFRVARRARVGGARAGAEGDTLTAGAHHDGYRRLPGAPVHRRDWTLTQGRLTVTDRIDPPAPAAARFHLHPDVRAEQTAPREGRLHLPQGRVLRWRAGLPVRVDPSTWHPEFGVTRSSTCLTVPFSDRAELALEWD